MNKKLIISLSVIGVVAAIAIGGTIAYFSDTETSVGNKFVAGKLNLRIDNTCHYNGKVCECSVPGQCFWQGTDEPCFCTWEEKDLAGELYFNLLDVKPGDNGEDTISLHVINNDAWVCAEIANLASDDNGCELPESLIDTSCGAGEGELKDNLLFTIWKDDDCNNILDAEEQVLVQNQSAVAGYWPIADSTNGTPLEGDKTYCIGVSWNVPLAAGNEIQTDSLIGDVIFIAVQSRNMPDFICGQEDGDGECVPTTEVCDGIDNDCDGQVDEGNPDGGGGCNTGLLGICAAGTTICQGGALICIQNEQPQAEVCDGSDNDCDGQVDEDDPNLYTPCDGADSDLCDEGIYVSCTAGNLVCSDTSSNNLEVCGDGFDNDCDGDIDCADADCNGQTCNDGFYCNGSDTCSAGSCSLHTGDPCPGPDGDSDCAESCNEASDNCTANDPIGSFCDDGLYCTGINSCNVAGNCAGSGNPCPGPDGDSDCSESCNETSDNCTANDQEGTSCLLPPPFNTNGSCHNGGCIPN